MFANKVYVNKTNLFFAQFQLISLIFNLSLTNGILEQKLNESKQRHPFDGLMSSQQAKKYFYAAKANMKHRTFDQMKLGNAINNLNISKKCLNAFMDDDLYNQINKYMASCSKDMYNTEKKQICYEGADKLSQQCKKSGFDKICQAEIKVKYSNNFYDREYETCFPETCSLKDLETVFNKVESLIKEYEDFDSPNDIKIQINCDPKYPTQYENSKLNEDERNQNKKEKLSIVHHTFDWLNMPDTIHNLTSVSYDCKNDIMNQDLWNAFEKYLSTCVKFWQKNNFNKTCYTGSDKLFHKCKENHFDKVCWTDIKLEYNNEKHREGYETCFPDSCSMYDLYVVFHSVEHKIKNEGFFDSFNFDINCDPNYVKNKRILSTTAPQTYKNEIKENANSDVSRVHHTFDQLNMPNTINNLTSISYDCKNDIMNEDLWNAFEKYLSTCVKFWQKNNFNKTCYTGSDKLFHKCKENHFDKVCWTDIKLELNNKKQREGYETCFPDSCSMYDLYVVFHSVENAVKKSGFLDSFHFDINCDPNYVKNKRIISTTVPQTTKIKIKDNENSDKTKVHHTFDYIELPKVIKRLSISEECKNATIDKHLWRDFQKYQEQCEQYMMKHDGNGTCKKGSSMLKEQCKESGFGRVCQTHFSYKFTKNGKVRHIEEEACYPYSCTMYDLRTVFNAVEDYVKDKEFFYSPSVYYDFICDENDVPLSQEEQNDFLEKDSYRRSRVEAAINRRQFRRPFFVAAISIITTIILLKLAFGLFYLIYWKNRRLNRKENKKYDSSGFIKLNSTDLEQDQVAGFKESKKFDEENYAINLSQSGLLQQEQTANKHNGYIQV